MDRIKLSILLSYYGSLFTVKQRSIMQQYIDDDYSLAEIAEREGITRQGVYDVVSNASAKLNQLESDIGMYRMVSAISESMAQLRTEMDIAADAELRFITDGFLRDLERILEE